MNLFDGDGVGLFTRVFSDVIVLQDAAVCLQVHSMGHFECSMR